MATIPTVTLTSGFKVPVLGFGTATLKNLPAGRLKEAFLYGLKVGYRHFDTAAVYGTEKFLGDAIAEALRQGLIQSREEIFVTSKLWMTDTYADGVLPALTRSLANLGLDYLDLYLIHWPLRYKRKEMAYPVGNEEQLPFDIKSTWAAMEECQRLGLVKSIGVSNFSSKKLSHLLSFASIPPAVNQVEMNPLWHQKSLRGFCRENGIHITAYSPLGARGTTWGSTAVLDTPVIKEIAQMKGKSVAQICLRWLHEQGVSIVVKSFNKERMNNNLQIFGWELSEEDHIKINKIPQMKGCTGEAYLLPNGPYKTVEDLWDEEI